MEMSLPELTASDANAAELARFKRQGPAGTQK